MLLYFIRLSLAGSTFHTNKKTHTQKDQKQETRLL